jgi:putative peptidoglycan lipid II flippase
MVAVRVPLLLAVPAVVEPRDVVAGLMLATSLTYVAGWILGDVALRNRLGTLRTRQTLPALLRIGGASAAGGMAAWLVVHAIGNLFGTGTAGSLVTVVIGTVVTGAVALAGLVVARVPELAEPLAAVRARVGRR